VKILITGAAGFIGQSVLAEVLRREHEVIALVRSSTPKDWEDIRNLEILRHDLSQGTGPDLRDQGIDVVLHLAAATSGRAVDQFQDTVVGTNNLLDAARRARIRCVVGISSLAVLDYQAMPPMGIIDERAPVFRCGRMGAYATTKLQQESLFFDFGRASGHSCTVLRPGLAYDKSKLIAASAGVIKGRIRLLVSHCGEVPTIEVGGLASAIANAAERHLPGCEVIHLVDDNLPSHPEYIAALRRRGVLPPGGVVIPWRVLRALCSPLGRILVATGLGGRLPEVFLPGEFSARLKPFRFSNVKAKQLLGWSAGREFA
jgi:nucleoside-diphosphate-sugar epimerase